jgi:polyphosphate glucokinase
MKVLVIDIGGTHVKILATGESAAREFESLPRMTPEQMVAGVKTLAEGWGYDAVSVGYPGAVVHNRPVAEPFNLGQGWVDFDFETAFGRPVKVINDAAMQALGGYHGGKMLFLGLGTGLGSAMIAEGVVLPMELGHLPYRKATYEDYVGRRGLERLGKKRWRRHVGEVIELLRAALLPGEIVLGGGNAEKVRDLPASCRRGDNANAFVGGFRLWEAKRRGKDAPATRRARGVSRAERSKEARQ